MSPGSRSIDQFLVDGVLFAIRRREPLQAKLPPTLILPRLEEKNDPDRRSLRDVLSYFWRDFDTILVCHSTLKFQSLHREIDLAPMI
jgi:hypothetical protein